MQTPQLILWAIAIVVVVLIVRKLATTHRVSFTARKKVSSPVKFKTQSGEKVSFRARKSKSVPVSFRARKK
jgi:hypothetical protein